MKMKSHLALCCSLLLASVALAGKLPGNSFANFSKPVRKDVDKSITAYLQQKHECRKFEVKNTRGVKEEGDILADRKGRLFGGVISEEWDVVACGMPLTFLLVISPDGSGGTYVAIAER
jgi:hypothetical protein